MAYSEVTSSGIGDPSSWENMLMYVELARLLLRAFLDLVNYRVKSYGCSASAARTMLHWRRKG